MHDDFYCNYINCSLDNIIIIIGESTRQPSKDLTTQLRAQRPTRNKSAPTRKVCHHRYYYCSALLFRPQSLLFGFEDLDLNTKDKEVLEKGGMLNDKHMHAVNKLLRQQYPYLQGFQSTLLSQSNE